MSKQDIALIKDPCLRCWFHGLGRKAVAPDPHGYAQGKIYCQDCADYIRREDDAERQRLLDQVPSQITHHSKEAT